MTKPFEAIATGAWPDTRTFSSAVRVGNLLFLSGTTATDDRGEIVGRGDIVAPYPTATGVIVAGLLREGALIEISAVAVVPDRPPPRAPERIEAP